MKKSKMLAIIALSVVLCIMIMCTSSFSWFTRGSQTGGYFTWSNNGSDTALSYNSSNGEGISMVTYSSPDGKTYGDNPSTGFGDTLAAGKRSYFRTDISNSSSADQSVSLYLSNVESTGGNFYLGVNDPLKTYKSYVGGGSDANKVQSVINQKNVYVGFVESQSPTVSDFQVHYWDKNNESYNGDATVTGNASGNAFATQKNYEISIYKYWANYNMYIATIPYDANSVILKQGNTYYKDEGDNTNVDTNNTILWYHYNNAFRSGYVKSNPAAGINTFYSEATVAKGKTLNIAADCQGESVQYSSSNNNVVTVDQRGNITGVSAGTATITVKSYGIYTDCISATCQVTVSEVNSEVPVITNLKIPAKTGDKDSVVSVYWYIKNDSDGASLTYKADDLYITL